jgi:hypothetical protein
VDRSFLSELFCCGHPFSDYPVFLGDLTVLFRNL